MMLNLIIIFYIVGWISFISGYFLVKSECTVGNNLTKTLWNSRINKLNKMPFRIIIDGFGKRNFLTISLGIFFVNGVMVIFQYLYGLIFLSPFLVIIQGCLMGAIVVQTDRKTQQFAIFTLLFELGAFSTAAAIGFTAGLAWVSSNNSLFASVQSVTSYLYLPILFLFFNAVFESSGMFWGVEGVPTMDAVKYKRYK